MRATDYNVNLRDIRFVVFEQMKVHEVLKAVPRYAEFDKDLYDRMLDAAADLAVNVLAPVNKVGDRFGAKFDGKGKVTTPPGYEEALPHGVARSGCSPPVWTPSTGPSASPTRSNFLMHENAHRC